MSTPNDRLTTAELMQVLGQHANNPTPYIPEQHRDDCEDTACVRCAEPTPLTPDREAEIRNRRYDEVTPGPWLVSEDQDGRALVYVERQTGEGQIYPSVLLSAESATEADVQFVASARRSVPELLAELDRARAELVAVPSEWDCSHGTTDDEPFCQELDETEHPTCPMVRVHRDDADRLTAMVDMLHELRVELAKVKSRLDTARQSARMQEMARQKVDAQIIILGDQLKKRGVTNAEISEWIESVS